MYVTAIPRSTRLLLIFIKANSRPMGMASGKPIAVTASAMPQPLKSEAIEVTMICGLQNMPKNGLEFHAATQGWASSQATISCTAVLSETLIVGLSGSSCLVPSAT